MKIIDSHLTPLDLQIEGQRELPKLAILGTCIAEHLLSSAQANGIPSAHFLLETWQGHPIPIINWDDFDAGIIHITLRHILDMAAGIEIGDVAYIDELEFENISKKATAVLKARIDEVNAAIARKKPIFYLSFIEPPQTTRGIFSNNRENSIYRLVRNLNDAMSNHLQICGGAYYVEVNDIVSYFGNGSCSDAYHQHFTHAGVFNTPESEKIYHAILQRISDALQILSGMDQIKIIITDLDNTLWKGVAAEEDEIIHWAHTEGWPIGYIEALLECKRRGILLAICSKNDEQKTIENFNKIWRNKISINDFCSVKINWDRKSINIDKILHEVNLLQSSAIFIDDNPLEIEEVKQAFPGIRTLSYPAERWRNILLHSPQLQRTLVTEESKNKTNLIKAKLARDNISQGQNHADWLQSLHIALEFDEIKNTSHPRFSRALELLNKTNQFNTTGRRWTEDELHTLFFNGGSIITVNAEDKFANHGLISLAIVADDEVVQIVLSCRVFGLGIEIALLNKVMTKIKSSGSSNVKALLCDTGKNTTCMSFYSDMGFIQLNKSNWIGIKPPAIPSWLSIS
jgi:FkbH-like protein